MEKLADMPPPPTQEELISALEKPVLTVMKDECGDDDTGDRVWGLRKNFTNWLYSQGLQQYAGALFQNILSQTSVMGGADFTGDEALGMYDYNQKHYTGFKRKFVAVIGNRLANTIAVPNNPSDEDAVRSTRSANAADYYITEQCDLEAKFLDQAGRLFDFGTTFWLIEWVEDGDKYGWEENPITAPQDQKLGNAHFQCQCGAATPSDGENPTPPSECSECGAPMSMQDFKPASTMSGIDGPTGQITRKAKGAQEIRLLDSNEFVVPLDACTIDDCDWAKWEREEPKGRLLRRYTKKNEDGTTQNPLRGDMDGTAGAESVSSQLGEMVRSAMSSPIGLVRQNRPNRWACVDIWWTLNQYELIKEDAKRKMLQDNFPRGARFVFVKGKLMEIRDERLQDVAQECKPEPSPRIMTQALGDEWTEATDIANNTMNQAQETIARSNLPLLVNVNKFDMQAWQNRNNLPAEVFPILPRANRALSDEIYQPTPVQFSEQIVPYRQQVIDETKNNTGLNDAIWGGGTPDPTARQTLLKTNQALMQLGTHWTQIRKAVEKLKLKACKHLAQYAEGVIAFSKKNQFGQFDTMSITVEDLRSDSYHFEADEAIPVNWGQQRDTLQWLLGQAGESPELMRMLGLDDPFNVAEYKTLLGIPGMHTPNEDARDKGMDVIGKLLQAKPQPGQPGPPNPDGSPGQPGPSQPSIQPDWEDPAQFMADLAKAYLLDNADLKTTQPDGYENVQLWGKAYEAIANPQVAPVPPKNAVSFAVKSGDIGQDATMQILAKQGLVDPNTQAGLSDADKKLQSDGSPQKLAMEAQSQQQELELKKQELKMKSVEHTQDLNQKQAEHSMNLQHEHEKHGQLIQHGQMQAHAKQAQAEQAMAQKQQMAAMPPPPANGLPEPPVN